jgi:hypothetical protein
LQGKPLSVSYEGFTEIRGFGEEELGRPKVHGGEIPLDSEMAFMYDTNYGKVEFGTKHGLKPVYRMLNQLLGGYQDRLLGGPQGLPDLCRTVPDGVRRKDYGGEVLG